MSTNERFTIQFRTRNIICNHHFQMVNWYWTLHKLFQYKLDLKFFFCCFLSPLLHYMSWCWCFPLCMVPAHHCCSSRFNWIWRNIVWSLFIFVYAETINIFCLFHLFENYILLHVLIMGTIAYSIVCTTLQMYCIVLYIIYDAL